MFRSLVFLLAPVALLGACDSGPANTPPSFHALVASDTSVYVLPDRAPDPVTLTADVHDPNGGRIETRWQASGGTFEETGTATASGLTVTWLPPSTPGLYDLRATADDGEDTTEHRLTIPVTPSLRGTWRGLSEASVQPPAKVCLYFYRDNALTTVGYSSGNGGYSSSAGVRFDAYRYPSLGFSVTFPQVDSTSSNDRITAFSAEMASDGTSIPATFTFLRRAPLQMVLTRVPRC